MNRILCFFVLSVCSCNLFSQSGNITGFLGINFGENAQSTLNKLKHRYSTATWNNNQINIQNVDLAGVIFDNVVVCFEQNKMSSGTFDKREQRAATSNPFSNDSGETAKEEAVSNNNYIYQKLNSSFNTLVSIFSSKYGKPSYRTANNVIWNDRLGHSINIRFEISCKYRADVETYFSEGDLFLIYNSRNGNSSDY